MTPASDSAGKTTEQDMFVQMLIYHLVINMFKKAAI